MARRVRSSRERCSQGTSLPAWGAGFAAGSAWGVAAWGFAACGFAAGAAAGWLVGTWGFFQVIRGDGGGAAWSVSPFLCGVTE